MQYISRNICFLFHSAHCSIEIYWFLHHTNISYFLQHVSSNCFTGICRTLRCYVICLYPTLNHFKTKLDRNSLLDMCFHDNHGKQNTPNVQKLTMTAREIFVNDLAQNVSNSTNHRAVSINNTRQSVKVNSPSAKLLHSLSQCVTDRLTFVDRLADRACKRL